MNHVEYYRYVPNAGTLMTPWQAENDKKVIHISIVR